MRARVGGLSLALAGIVVACGSGNGANGLSDLPDGVFAGIVAPGAGATVGAGPDAPLVVAVQVDPRTIDTNCSVRVTILVSDDTGSFAPIRTTVLEPPIRTELVQVSLAFTIDDPSAKPTDGEEDIEVPIDVPDPGTYNGVVRADIIAPEVDDPTSKLSQYDICRAKLGLEAGVTDGLGASQSFILDISQGAVATTDAPTTETTIDDGSSTSEETTTTSRWGGGTTRTTVGPTTTVSRSTTTSSPTTTESTTTTTIYVPPPTLPPTTVEPSTTTSAPVA